MIDAGYRYLSRGGFKSRLCTSDPHETDQDANQARQVLGMLRALPPEER
jgi:hypothetical protein